ncbi:MAG: hypothetical protein ACK4K7_13380 [Allosphingosinicella sp.]|uniref:hypothetical protein n=1 Tax=Allosphingosinicella sp. TaxID=2823234 RepID=UPI003929B511
MKPIYLTLAAGLTVAAVALAIGGLAPASAQSKGGKAKTPDNWSYEVRDGRRVPRGNRVTNPDGSWREEIRQGDCTVIKTMSADGEYREVREC